MFNILMVKEVKQLKVKEIDLRIVIVIVMVGFDSSRVNLRLLSAIWVLTLCQLIGHHGSFSKHAVLLHKGAGIH